MNKAEILEFINSNPACYLATSENNVPHVRGMLMYRADEKGITFHTGSMKDLSRQLHNNPNVELCFFSSSRNIQIRVSGKAIFIEDEEVKKEIVEHRPFLKPWVEKMGLEILTIFRVVDCIAHTWSFETNFSPKEYIRLSEGE
ncbi:MAG: pyridoxamine 5'-phosphate oxidase family protein [bacterium]